MPRNAVDALLDEWDRSRREIVDLLPRLRDADLEGGDPLDETRPRGILIHVLRAAWGQMTWVCEVLDFPKPERGTDPKTLAGREAFQRAFHELRTGFFRGLEPLQDAHLYPPPDPPRHYPTRSGEEYGIEQMLEHAICHNLRHRRQLQRLGASSVP